jgi:hypothetical protein
MVAAFIATAGPEVEHLASELMCERDELAAVIVNAVGAERAEAAEAAVIQLLREQARPDDYAPTLPYSPGYCGMALVEQRKLFALFEGETVGVILGCAKVGLFALIAVVLIGPICFTVFSADLDSVVNHGGCHGSNARGGFESGEQRTEVSKS